MENMLLFVVGFLEKEIKKDFIPMLDTGDNPDAPAPREMIDLEVGLVLYWTLMIVLEVGLFHVAGDKFRGRSIAMLYPDG